MKPRSRLGRLLQTCDTRYRAATAKERLPGVQYEGTPGSVSTRRFILTPELHGGVGFRGTSKKSKNRLLARAALKAPPEGTALTEPRPRSSSLARHGERLIFWNQDELVLRRRVYREVLLCF
jgi:hypothetical protein